MVQKRWARLWISMTLAGGLLGVATAARAADDTTRFYGTWKTEFPYYGQMVTLVSVHDSSGYKNYVLVSDGPAWVPLFVNAQDGKVASWQRAMDPPGGSGEQLSQIYGRLLHGSQPAHGNNGYDALECVVEIQQTGNCAR